ncbi:S8 family serine peptidase [Cellulomonas sp. JZ18]|uniref:S8 family serine peptidase n=1 Tax=Cellulomonas sp. JZ18 TaxID=2654191 RepID=UPI0012D38C39|nr:S8 family serine peptidase [Cellulomonas sp. JZ18]QGQ19285.1 S8 family serine peptidase [Cellulomonas sp. JZ18]
MCPPDPRERFLVGGEPTVLRAVEELLTADPDVDVVAVTTGRAGPARLVVTMHADQAEALAAALARLVVVEQDTPCPTSSPTTSTAAGVRCGCRPRHTAAGARTRATGATRRVRSAGGHPTEPPDRATRPKLPTTPDPRPPTTTSPPHPDHPCDHARPDEESTMSEPTASGTGGTDHAAPVRTRPRRYLVAQDEGIAPMGAGPLDFGWVVEQLRTDPAVDVVTELVPRDLVLQQTGASTLRTVVVAAMPPSTAAELATHPQIVLEEDVPVHPSPVPLPGAAATDPAAFVPFGTATEWRLQVRGADGAPVTGAAVYLYGSGVPAQGRTDGTGTVALSLAGETDATLRALYVNPQRDHWSLWVDEPALVAGATNTVTLRSLTETFPGFPAEQLLGWGQRAMRLDRVPRELDGRGVRVAVVDSGAAARTHGDLGAVRGGVDLTTVPANPTGWTDDVIAHGSHCGGIVAGADDGSGIRGFAPGAEVHHVRIFPGGRVSSLLEAVDYCIEQQVDVVNMSLGSGGTSQLLLQKLAQAREQGVACIVAAGNSGGPVQFPGSSPDVLTVAAIGRHDEFPADSYHAQQVLPGGRTDGDDYFAARFSCHGPEVDVCGPGVAVVSSVPPAGFAAWDGTSMATPHVAGLAALVLAHHPDFRTPGLALRTGARVDRLFEILRGSATPLDLGDATRTGAGLPDAVRALALDDEGRPGQDQGADEPAAARFAIEAALERLRQQLVAAGLLEASTAPAAAPAPSAPSGPQPPSAPQAGAAATGAADLPLRRRLAGLEAQLAAAGLVVTR